MSRHLWKLPLTSLLLILAGCGTVVRAEGEPLMAKSDAPAAVDEVEGIWPEDGDSVDAEPVLQWVAFPGAVRYELVVVDDDAYPPYVAFRQFTTDTVLPVTTILEPGSYSWTVRALDDESVTLAELNRQFLVKDRITALGPASGAVVGAAPALVWEAYPGAAGYQVIVLDDDAYPPVVIVEENTTATSFTITAPLEPGSYSWTVWAKTAEGVVVAELDDRFTVE
jgi:hypothetical protein